MTSPAADVLQATIELRKEPPTRRALRAITGLVLGAVTGDATTATSNVDLVVTRLDTGREIIRTPGGSVEEADLLLKSVRSDLESKSVEDFLREWHVFIV